MHAYRYSAESFDCPPSPFHVVHRPFVVALLLTAMIVSSMPGAQAETLRVTAYLWPPYISPDLPDRGLAMALVTEALHRLGFDTEVRIENQERALEGTRLGVYDLVVGVWQTDELTPELSFSEPFLVNDLRFITLTDNAIEYQQLEDLQGLMIGTLHNYPYDSSFLNNSKLIRVPRSHVVQNLNALLEGAIDLTVADRFTALHAIQNYLPDSRGRFRFLKKPLETRNLYIAVSRKLADHERIVEEFNQTIKTMRTDGTYDAILRRYNF